MPNPRDVRELDHGQWRFVGDRRSERELFLIAIQRKAPQVLTDLFQTVLPLHLESRRREPRPRRIESYIPPTFWELIRDFETWTAAWAWADRTHLSRGMDLELLKRRRAVNLARWCWGVPYWSGGKWLPRELKMPFRVDTSPEVTFGMPLIAIVWLTLEFWADFGVQGDALKFCVPFPRAPLRAFTKLDNYCEIKVVPDLCPLHYEKWSPIPRITYEFVALGWDIFKGETRAQAKKAIMEEVEKQLEEKLDESARHACTKPYLERIPEIREKEHFEWLVLYQVNQLHFSDVTRKVKPQPERAPKDTAAFRSDKAAVTDGIKRAAERLIGPRFTDWLRPGEPGRRRHA